MKKHAIILLILSSLMLYGQMMDSGILVRDPNVTANYSRGETAQHTRVTPAENSTLESSNPNGLALMLSSMMLYGQVLDPRVIIADPDSIGNNAAVDLTKPTGKIMYSPTHKDHPGTAAFDNQDVYDDNYRWLPLYSTLPNAWVIYEFERPGYAVKSYRVWNSAYDYEDRAPKAFSLYGSNDNEDWVLLDSRKNQTGWGPGEVRTFSVDNDKVYTYYKFNISEINGDLDYAAISELELFDVDLLNAPESHSDVKPLDAPAMDVMDVSLGDDDVSRITGVSLGSVSAVDLTEPTGKIMYSPSHNNYPGTAAFDNQDVNGAGYRWLALSSTLPNAWVIYEFERPGAVVRSYRVWNTAVYNYAVRAPKAFTLSGSNNNKDWVLLDSRTSETDWKAGEARTFSFKNDNAYTYYKFNISEVNGNAKYAAISELELFGIDMLSSAPGNIKKVVSSVESPDDAKGYARVRDDGDVNEFLVDGMQPYLIDINAPIEENLAYWNKALDESAADNLYELHTDSEQVTARSLFNEGRKLAEVENYTAAISKLEDATIADPSYAPAWELLGRLYWQNGDIDEAISIWEQIINIDDSLGRIHNLLGQAYTTKGNMKKALQYYEKSNEISPDDVRVRFALAKLYLWTGRTDEAVDLLDTLVLENPDDIQILEQYARALSSNREYSKSLSYWSKLRDMDPSNDVYKMYEAKAMLRAGAPEMAIQNATEILENDPNNLTVINIIGDAAQYGSDADVALEKLKDLFDNVDNDMAKRNLYYRYVMTWIPLSRENPEKYPINEAVDYVQKIVDIDPRNVSDRLLLAELLIMDNQPSRGIEILEDILKYDNPNNKRAFAALYEAYVAKRDFKKAREYYKKLEAFDPRDPYLYYRQAILLAAEGKYYEAFESLDELERLGAQGSVRVFLYHGISPSEYTGMPSQRRLREHLLSLREAGFRFISPDEIPDYLESCQQPPLEKKESFIRRMVKSFSSALDADYEENETKTIRDFTPELVAAVTFDDSLRSSFKWATPVAEEMGITFGMHVPVWNVDVGDPIVASWQELRKYREGGYWSLGSHLYKASMPAPIDEEGYLVYPLPNRLWLEDEDRIETPWEYQDRIKHEFASSREIMLEKLNIPEDKEDEVAKYVAYPMGDVGQETVSNVRNATKTILSESELTYDMGFIQSSYGYAVKGQNPLLYQRNEPDRFDDGKDVVNFAFKNHPVFLARATKAELAAQQGKLYLALEMLDELDRDGYPKDMLDELREYVKLRLGQNAGIDNKTDGNSVQTEKTYVRLADPYIGGDYYFLDDNEDTEHSRLTGYAGLQINPSFVLQVDGGVGKMKQHQTTYEPGEYTVLEETPSRVITYTDTIVDNGSVERVVIDQEVITYEEVTVYTNIITKNTYEADEESIGVKGILTFPSGVNLSMGFGERSYTSDSPGNEIDEDSALYGYLNLFWKPTLALDVNIGYQHDVMVSPQKLFTYDGLDLLSYWRIKDNLDMYVSALYQMVSDDNNILNMSGRLAWTLSERQNFRMGLNGHFITADDDSVYYWTPFWLQRYYIFGEFKKTFRDAYARFEVRLGTSKDSARDEEKEEYAERVVQAEDEGWYPGPDPDSGWESLIGATVAYKKTFLKHLELFGELNLDYVGDYSEREVLIGLTWNFF